MRGLALAGLLGVVLLPGAAGAAARPYLGLAAEYKRGDFGTGTASTLYSAVFNGGLVAEEWDAGFAMPFHVLSTEGEDSEIGAGDLVLHGGHTLVPEVRGFALYGSAALKVPTADESAGLGTGETDAGAFLRASQRLGAWETAVFGGYTVTGDPPGTDYNDVAAYGVQLTRLLQGAAVYAGLEGRTAVTDDLEDPREAFVGGFRLLPGGRALTVDAFAGLSDGSPDFGLRVGAVQWF
ncbi:MAG TPA: hypothetical protein VKA55_08910 [Gammaproteobacteria bacterium]|nr:hypothetical protein [Gammaproteobacteria bacterium]